MNQVESKTHRYTVTLDVEINLNSRMSYLNNIEDPVINDFETTEVLDRNLIEYAIGWLTTELSSSKVVSIEKKQEET
jgi:hypothetical protein